MVFKAFTEKQALRQLREQRPDFTLVGSYKGQRKNHEFVHACGRTVSRSWSNLVNGAGTCECNRQKTGPKPRTAAQIKKLLRESRPDYRLVSPYTQVSDQHTMRHLTCGTEFSATVDTLLRFGSSCPCTHSKLKFHTFETWQARLEAIGSAFYLVSIDGDNEFTVRHRECGHERTVVKGFFNVPTATCTTCFGKFGHARSVEQFQQVLNDYWPGQFSVVRTIDAKVGPRRYVVDCNAGHPQMLLTSSDLSRSRICFVCCPTVPHAANLKMYERNGEVKQIQGVEDVALDWILLRGYDLRQIQVHAEHGLKIPYTFRKKSHTYWPDFYLPAENRVVEVKTIESLGFGCMHFSDPAVFHRNVAKAKATKLAGFKYNLLVMDRRTNSRVALPKGWVDMTRRQLGMELGLI